MQIEERDAANNLQKRNIFKGMLSPVLMEKGAASYYYHQNEMNTVEAITDGSGNLVERYEYDPYGKPTLYNASNTQVAQSPSGNHFALTGQQYDAFTNTYKFHYRNYSPFTGTFLQRDLIGYADGMGMYQYVGNNPANGLDVFGLDDCKPKPTLRFEQVPQQPNVVLMVTQLTLDETGNTGFLLSLVDLPRQLAENAYRAEYLKAFNNFGKFGEAAFTTEGLANAGSKFSNLGSKLPGVTKLSGALGKAGPALGFIDLGVKTANYNNVLNDPASNSMDVMDAQYDIVGSGGNLVAGIAILGAGAAGSALAVPAGIGLGVVAIGDVVSTYTTGKNLRQLTYDPMYNSMYGDVEYQQWIKAFGLENSEFLRNIFYSGKGETYLRTIRG